MCKKELLWASSQLILLPITSLQVSQLQLV